MYTEDPIHLLFLLISDWTLSTWKDVLCSGVNAELYCVVCMWAMSTFAVAYLSLLLISFLLAPLSYACLYSTHNLYPTWIWMGAGFTFFVIWNDILQFCPRRFHCRWKQLRQERRCGFTHMQFGSDVQSMVICLDASLQTFCLFQCLILFPYLFQVPWDCCD